MNTTDEEDKATVYHGFYTDGPFTSLETIQERIRTCGDFPDHVFYDCVHDMKGGMILPSFSRVTTRIKENARDHNPFLREGFIPFSLEQFLPRLRKNLQQGRITFENTCYSTPTTAEANSTTTTTETIAVNVHVAEDDAALLDIPVAEKVVEDSCCSSETHDGAFLMKIQQVPEVVGSDQLPCTYLGRVNHQHVSRSADNICCCKAATATTDETAITAVVNDDDEPSGIRNTQQEASPPIIVALNINRIDDLSRGTMKQPQPIVSITININNDSNNNS